MAQGDRQTSDFEEQRRQAAERMREMQRRARPVGNAPHEMPPTPAFVRLPGREAQPEQPEPRPAKPRRSGGFDLLRRFRFDDLELDGDRTLLLTLTLLLASEDADELLLLALLYLML